MLGLFESTGVVTSADQQRALSEQEITNRDAARWRSFQQGVRSTAYLAGAANWQPPQRPLDERFADFKVRLAAALEKRRIA